MANYFKTTISNKITQEFALDIFQSIAKQKVRDFTFVDETLLYFETRGFPNIEEVCIKHGVTYEDCNIIDKDDLYSTFADAATIKNN